MICMETLKHWKVEGGIHLYETFISETNNQNLEAGQPTEEFVFLEPWLLKVISLKKESAISHFS